METEEAVISKIRTRRNAGRVKYNRTMERDDLGELQWLTHAQEEAMDLSIYLERLMRDARERELALRSTLQVMREEADHLRSGVGYAYPELQDRRDAVAHAHDFWAAELERILDKYPCDTRKEG